MRVFMHRVGLIIFFSCTILHPWKYWTADWTRIFFTQAANNTLPDCDAFIFQRCYSTPELLCDKQMRQPITMVVMIGRHVETHVIKTRILTTTSSQSIADKLRYLASRCSGFSDEALACVKQTNTNCPTVFLKYVRNWLWRSFNSSTRRWNSLGGGAKTFPAHRCRDNEF